MAALADPPVVFDVQVRTYKKRQFVLVEVQEFEDVPIICRRTYPRSPGPGQKLILRKVAIYVRPRRKPETSEVEDETDLRELLELATEKRLQRLMGTVSRAGGTLLGGVSADLPLRREPTGHSGVEPAHSEPQDRSRVEPVRPELALQAATEAFLSELPEDFR